MHSLRLLITTLLILFAGSTSVASASNGSEKSDAVTKIEFDASASQLVDNDSMRARLFVEVQDSSSAAAATRVTHATNQALRTLREDAQLRVRTGAYRTYPVTDKGEISSWRARSELIVESEQLDRVSSAIEAVSGTMQLASVEFFPSEKRREETESVLVDRAIKAFLVKARTIANSFGAKQFEIAKASIGNPGGISPPQPVMRTMAADSMAAAPEFGSGTTRLTVTVAGTILIRR